METNMKPINTFDKCVVAAITGRSVVEHFKRNYWKICKDNFLLEM